ncbi:MAG: hypothetical protein ACC618_00880 [Patescibacteria group bacterium]
MPFKAEYSGKIYYFCTKWTKNYL